jgi:hypothetical protein
MMVGRARGWGGDPSTSAYGTKRTCRSGGRNVCFDPDVARREAVLKPFALDLKRPHLCQQCCEVKLPIISSKLVRLRDWMEWSKIARPSLGQCTKLE